MYINIIYDIIQASNEHQFSTNLGDMVVRSNFNATLYFYANLLCGTYIISLSICWKKNNRGKQEKTCVCDFLCYCTLNMQITTDSPLGDVVKFCFNDYKAHPNGWYLDYFLCNCPQANAIGPHRGRININSGNGLLTHIYDCVWRHLVTIF